MKNKLTKPIIVIVLILGFYGLINFALNNFLSGPRLKAMLIAPVEKVLARDVTVGSIKVSIFKGININDISVKDFNSQENFASIDSFILSYDLLALFKRKLVITSFALNNPKVNIIKNNEGVFNVASLGASAPKKEEEPNYDEEPIDPIPLDISFDDIKVNGAILTFTDMTKELPDITAESNASFSLKIGANFADSLLNGTVNVHANADYKDKKPVLILEGKFKQKSISFQGSLNMEFDRFIFNGKVNNYMTSPEVKLNVNSPKINLDNLMALFEAGKAPVKTSQGVSQIQQPKETASETLDEPLNFTDQTEALASVPIGTETSVMTEQPEPSLEAQAQSEISEQPESLTAEPERKEPESPENPRNDIPAIKKTTVSYLGELTINQLVSKNFQADNIKLVYSLEDNLFQAKNVAVTIFGGEVTGNIKLDLGKDQPPIIGDIQTKSLQVSKLLEKLGKPSQILSGALATNLKFNGTGLSWTVLQKTLNGAGEYTLSNGGIKSPISSSLALLLDIPELQNIQYKNLSGSFDIEKGNVLLNASLAGPQFDMTSAGYIGLNGALDMPLKLTLSPEYSQRMTDKASFSNYLADDQGRISINLKMSGTTSEPQITVDEAQIVEKAKEVVVKKAEGELQKLISKELGDNPQEENIVKGLSEKLLNEMFKK